MNINKNMVYIKLGIYLIIVCIYFIYLYNILCDFISFVLDFFIILKIFII